MRKGTHRGLSRRGMFIAALVVFTGANAFVQARRAGGEPVNVTTFDVGDRIQNFEVKEIGPGPVAPRPLLASASCQLIVVFSPSCPYCHKAALEEQSDNQEDRLPTTWVTDESEIGHESFIELVHPESSVAIHPEALKRLKIQAVPAVILVGEDGVVLDHYAYSGTEDHEELRAQCQA